MSLATLKKLILYLLVLAVCYFAADRVLAYGLQTLLDQANTRFSKLYSGGMDADIVVMGNSRAVNAFFAPEIEKQLDKSVFHLAYNGMSMTVAEVLFRDYLERNEKPEMLLLEITNVYGTARLFNDLKLFMGKSDRLQESIADYNKPLAVACQVSNLYRFNSEMYFRSLYYIDRSDQSWINTGQVDAEYAQNYTVSQEDKDTKLFPTDNDNWEALLRIVELCRDEGISLRLVATPYLPAFRNGITDFDTWVADFRVALPGDVRFYDLSESLTSNEYFADVLHINRSGSVLLLEEMIEEGVFEGDDNGPSSKPANEN